MLCPRRRENPSSYTIFPGEDSWETRGGLYTHCSYCGSLNPDTLLELIQGGLCTVGPTDKNYKAYIAVIGGEDHIKFYYQHFSEDQKLQFFNMYRDQTVMLGYPGYFYVLPYFIQHGAEVDG